MKFIRSKSPTEITSLTAAPNVECDAEKFAQHHADLHLACLEAGNVVACCSLWWSNVPSYLNEKLGAIGHLSIASNGTELLNSALQELHAQGCTFAVGPMDGNTWRTYRLQTEVGSEPPFFLEPQNPPDWPTLFVQTGFTPIAQYFSALNTDLTADRERTKPFQQRMEAAGVKMRVATPKTINDDLVRIFRVSLASFQNNFLYSPLSQEEFAAQYQKILPYVDPRMVLLAERESETVGFAFSIPDMLQKKRGETIDTFILKTIAILPEPSLRGLGSLLVAESHRKGHELGYRRCIHALMHENNTSLNISRHYATPIRRYTLYGRSLLG